VASLYEKLESDGGSADEYGAVRIDRDVFRLESRSGRTAGIINLSKKPWQGGSLGEGVFLTDHRIQGGLFFAPHSITIAQEKG
jgi:alpha-galactosidase